MFSRLQVIISTKAGCQCSWSIQHSTSNAEHLPSFQDGGNKWTLFNVLPGGDNKEIGVGWCINIVMGTNKWTHSLVVRWWNS